MNTKKPYCRGLLRLAALCGLLAFGLPATAQSTMFQYQGHLTDQGNPANGAYDLQFSLYDALTNGDQIGPILTNSATTISNGLFLVALDFGNVFNGNSYWLQIAARTNGGGTFAYLAPRQPITSVPYAITAANALGLTGALAASQISGTIPLSNLPVSVVTNGATGINLAGTFMGNGAGLTNLNGTNLPLTGLPAYSPEIVSAVINDFANPPALSTVTLSNWVLYLTYQNALATNPFSVLGASQYTYDAANYLMSPSYDLTGESQTVNNPTYADNTPLNVGFKFYGNTFGIFQLARGQTPLVEVDGIASISDANAATYALSNDGHYNLTVITLNTFGWHTVVIKNLLNFLGLEGPPQAAFEPLPLKNNVYVWGDSVTEGVGAPDDNGAYFDWLNLDPAFQNVWVNSFGEGGTGWVATDLSYRTNILGRTADMQAVKPQYLLISISNDNAYATNSILTNNTLYSVCYQAMTNIVALFPNQHRLLGGPMPLGAESMPGDSTWLATEIIRAAGLASGFIVSSNQFIDYTQPPLLTYGTAAEFTSTTASPHPNVEGHYNIAQRIKAAVMANWPEVFGNPSTSLAGLSVQQLSAGTVTSGAAGLTNCQQANLELLTNGIPTPVPGLGILWNSNNALYWVTTSHTNYISGP